MQDDAPLRDVMTREFVGVSESDSLRGAAQLLCDEGAETAVVLRGSEPVGVITGRDLREFVASGDDPEETAVSEVMSPPPAVLTPDDRLAEATAALVNGDGDLLVTTGDREVVGTLDARDVVAASASVPEEEPVATGTTGPADRREGGRAAYSSQSICEGCGSLTRDLADVNGQLLCGDCRDV